MFWTLFKPVKDELKCYNNINNLLSYLGFKVAEFQFRSAEAPLKKG